MNPLLELRRRLASAPAAYVGRVVSVEAAAVAVQTARGRARAALPAGLAVSVGDEVLVRDGVVQGRLQSEDEVPVYRL